MWQKSCYGWYLVQYLTKLYSDSVHLVELLASPGEFLRLVVVVASTVGEQTVVAVQEALSVDRQAVAVHKSNVSWRVLVVHMRNIFLVSQKAGDAKLGYGHYHYYNQSVADYDYFSAGLIPI